MEAVIFRLPPEKKREVKAKIELEGKTIQEVFSKYALSLLGEKNKETD